MDIKQFCTKHNVDCRDTSACWFWIKSVFHNGYGRVQIGGKSKRAHRVAFELAYNIKPDKLVLHKCDNPSCINPDHLFLGSQLDNMRDMISKGRKVVLSGTSHPCTKITIDQFHSIKSDPRHSSVLAKIYGLSKAYVDGIKNGRKTRAA